MPNPKKGEDIFKFKNWKRRMQVPYYFIADFEAMPITLPSQALEALKKTKKIQEHIPCSFSYTKIRYDGVSEASKMYVGKNAETKFVTDITREAFQIQEEYKDPKPMLPLTAQDQRRHDNATQCWVCKKEFGTQEVWISTLDGERYKAIYNGKVKDHCHITGKYRGPAHNDCNIQLQIKAGKMHIPVIFHNLSGYDSHIIMKGIGAMECPDDIEPIPYNMKNMEFKLRSLRFLDSMQFMKSNLDKLASNLGAVNCKKITRTKPGHL